MGKSCCRFKLRSNYDCRRYFNFFWNYCIFRYISEWL